MIDPTLSPVDRSIKLSDDFFLHEFCDSQRAARMGRPVVPTEVEIANLKRLCAVTVQPIRTRIGRVMMVDSGLRPIWLNTAIGGEKDSAHIWGGAGDFKVKGMSATSFAKWIVIQSQLPSALPIVFDKVIEEFGEWVHIQGAKPGATPRFEYWIARYESDGKKTYTPGDIHS